MDLKADVEEIQRDVDQLRTGLEDFENGSKIIIRDDQVCMFTALKESVDSVQTTFTLLDTRKTLAINHTESHRKSTTQDKTHEAALRQHVTVVSSRFQTLQRSADRGLERVQGIKKKWDDYEAELRGIKIRLTSVLERCKTSRQNAEKLLEDKTTAMEKAWSTLDVQKTELQELERKIESEKITRDAMAPLAAVSFGASLIFFPMVLVSAAFATAALGAVTDLRQFKREVRALRTRHESLKSEHKSLKEQKAWLERTAVSAEELLFRCKTLMPCTDRMRPLVEVKLQFYQDLKLTTDDFAAWTSDLNSQAETMDLLGRSDKVIQSGMERIVDTLVKQDHTDVRRICAPLLAHATKRPSTVMKIRPPGKNTTHTPPTTMESVLFAIFAGLVCLCLFNFVLNIF